MPIKAIKLRAGFLLLLFTLMFLSSNSLITEVNAETLEESFKVTPLPFWDISTYGTDISFIKNSILVNGTPEVHEDSELLFQETTPNDYWYYPDPVSFQSYSGSGFGSGSTSGTHTSTQTDDSNYYSRTGMTTFALGGIYIDIENVPYQYSQYQIHINAVFRAYRTAGVGTCDGADFGLMEIPSGFPSVIHSLRDYTDFTDTGYVTIDETFTLIDSDGFDSGKMRFGMTLYDVSGSDTWRIDLDYIQIEIIGQYNYQESFLDISDYFEPNEGTGQWEAGESISTDKDVMIFSAEGDSANDRDMLYCLTPNFSYWEYVEIRYKLSGTNTDIYLYILDEEDTGDFHGRWGYALIETTSWTTKRISYWHPTATYDNYDGKAECIYLSVKSDNGIDIDFYLDYLNIGFNNESGQQFDGSTTQPTYNDGSANWIYTDSTDGDNLALNITRTSAGNSWAYYQIVIDKTSTQARFERDYYQIVSVRWRCTTLTAESIYPVYYFNGYKSDGQPNNDIFDWTTTYFNIAQMSSAYSPTYDGVRFCVKADALGEKAIFEIDSIKCFSLADYEVTDISDETSATYFYVNNSVLIITDIPTDYIRFNFDKKVSVDVSLYPIWNATVLAGENYFRFLERADTWYYHDTGITHGILQSTILTDFDILAYEGVEITNLEFWSHHEFEIKIPIDQFKNHKFEFMISTDNITTGSLDFSIYHNLFPSNWNFQLDFDTDFFTQRDYELNISNYDFLRFKADLKYSVNTYDIDILDVNKSKIGENLLYHNIIKTGNTFSISSENFTGSFYLYYFTGNVDYVSAWNRDISNQDSEIYQTDYSAELSTATTSLSHSSIRNLFVSGFQFWRSEYIVSCDLSGYGTGDTFQMFLNATFEFYYPNGTLQYLIYADIGKDLNYGGSCSKWGNVRVFHYSNNIETMVYESPIGAHITSETSWEISQKFAIWRTQENHLGIKFKGKRWNLNEENFSVWISDLAIENFQCNITHEFSIIYDGFTYTEIVLTFDALEYSYNQMLGVSEPHFSTTWWDSIPIIGPIINAFIIVGNAIALAIEAGLLPIELLISAVADSIISAIVSAIGGVAGTVWGLFESTLDSIGFSIDAVANDIWGLFTGILDTISGVIDDIYSTISDTYTAIVNLSSNLIASIGTGISNALVPAILVGIQAILDEIFNLWEYELNLVGTALGWGTVGTFLFDFTDAVVLTVPSWLEFLINTSVTMVNVLVWANLMWSEYGAMFILYGTLFVAIDILGAVMTLDLDKIGDCLSKYVKVIIWIVEFVFNIISTVLNAIWGILPF